jgi:hypothetical protein
MNLVDSLRHFDTDDPIFEGKDPNHDFIGPVVHGIQQQIDTRNRFQMVLLVLSRLILFLNTLLKARNVGDVGCIRNQHQHKHGLEVALVQTGSNTVHCVQDQHH